MSYAYLPRQELWVISCWEDHGIQRAEYIERDGKWIRYQFDDGRIVENDEKFVYRAKRYAIASVIRKALLRIAEIEERLPEFRQAAKSASMVIFYEKQIAKFRAIIRNVTA